jgi:predicted  nucleic acid-binding Zn-ribbon protein
MSMPLSARRFAPSTGVERFPDRSAEANDVVLSARDTAAVSAMLRQAKGAIASLREQVAALEGDLRSAEERARTAEEAARAEAASRAADQRHAHALGEKLAEALAQHETLEAHMGEALTDREQRMWSAEARAQEFERRALDAEARAAAAESREWEAKARLGRVRDALDQ